MQNINMTNKNYIQISSMRMSEEERKTCFKKGISYLDQGRQEDLYCKHNMLAGIKKESNQDQVIQLNISACKEKGQCNYLRQYSGLKIGDNYSFGFMR